MNRAQIIEDLMETLAAIRTENGFATQPAEIRRGIHLAEDMNERPALCLFNEKVETIDATSGTAQRILFLHLWGVANAPQADYSGLDHLAADCLKALADPALNPYWAATSAVRLLVYEGGAGDPLGLFDLHLQVSYEAGLGEL